MSTKNVMIVGVGGQGSLLASKLLGRLLLDEGYDVKVSEVHGMSQRGGSVVTYVRYGEHVYSPVIDKGEADVIVSFELLEAARFEKFRNHIDGLLSHIDEIPGDGQQKKGKKNDIASSKIMDTYMMESYLFDPFCNLMIRLMMIEQFHNEEIRVLYEKTLFTDPYEIYMNVFKRLAKQGAFLEEQAEIIVRQYHAYMTMLTYKYLLNGELTEERKKAYAKEVHKIMNGFGS